MKTAAFILMLAATQLASAASDDALEQLQRLRLAGDYPGAITLIEAELDQEPGNALLRNQLGELQYETGQLELAKANFEQLIPLAGPESLSARLNLALLYRDRGAQPEAEALLSDIRAAYSGNSGLNARDLYAVANATAYFGRDNPQLFKEAVRLFGLAQNSDPSDLAASLALGELLLDKYNNTEALEVFSEILRDNPGHPRALLGLARSQHFDYSSEALYSAIQALQGNPNLVPARVFLARLYLELEQYDGALQEVGHALRVNPVSLEALSLQAAIHYLERDIPAFDAVRNKLLELNPQYATFYTTLAELAAQNRLYREAAGFAQRAIELNPKSWSGYGLLGMNQLRLGLMDKGLANLESSFSGDPYNVWIKNTLALADNFGDYVEVDQDQFRIVMHQGENALLAEYIHELTASAYAHFKTRYQHQPDAPIRIELYPDHADFSVRTVGLAGVGLLGACFGQVVAMDSPAARARGTFNWGSTLWHELAHVFHLSISENRVPRWFSEGLAVYEERSARPGWGADVSPGFLRAYLEGRLLPVSELNNGFMRPAYPEQVEYSYFQAALVFEFIEQRWGFEVIRKLLHGYRTSTNNEQLLSNALALDIESLDLAFDAFFKQKYARSLAALGTPDSGVVAAGENYFAQFETGQTLYQEGDLEQAEAALLRAQALFPEHATTNSSYWLLASLYQQQGRAELAEQQLERLVAINAEFYEAHLQLASLRAASGNLAAAVVALEAAIYIYPYEVSLHQDLAAYLASLGAWDRVAREWRVLLALDPVDKAEAFYQLAFAYQRAGNRVAAREQVIYALEIAPNFYPAQELLLSFRDNPATP